VVRGTFIDPSSTSLYQAVDYPEVRIPSPDGIDRVEPVNFQTVQDARQAQRLVNQRIARMLYTGRFTATFGHRAWKVQKNDIVRLTFAPLGWVNKLFRVAEAEVQVNGQVPMVLQVEHPDIYLWDRDERPAIQPVEPTRYDPYLNPVYQGIEEAGESAIWDNITGEGKPEDSATAGGTIGVDIRIPEIPGIPAPPGLLRNDLLSLRADGMLQYQPYPDNADIKVALGQVAVPDVAGQLELLPDGTLRFENSDGSITALGRIRLPDIGAASDTSRRVLETALDEVSAAVARVVSEASQTRATFRDAGFYVDPASGQIRISAIDQTRERISTAELRIDATEASVALRATTSYVDNRIAQALLDPTQIPIFTGLELRVSDVEVRLSGAEASIAQRATLIDLNLLGGRVTIAQQAIDALNGQIVQKVDSTQFNALGARVATAEQTIGALGDTASITQAISAVRMLPREAADAQEAALRALLAGDAASRYQIASIASARTELTAKINDDLSAEAQSRIALAVRVGAAEASALEETQTRASETQAITLRVTLLTSQFNDSAATFTAQIATLASDTEALAARAETLEAQVGDAVAAIEREEAARIADDGAISATASSAVSAARGLNTRVDEALDIMTSALLRGDNRSRELSGAIAAARDEVTAKINSDVDAVIGRVQILLARINGADAAIVLEQVARATQGEAMARQILTLAASVEGSNASFTQQISVLAASSLAATLRMDTMESDIGDNASAIQEEASTRADAVGQVEAAARRTVAAVRGVDASASDAAEQALRSLLTGDAAQRDTKTIIAAARDEVTAKINDDVGVLVQRLSLLLARMGLAEASILSEQIARVTADGAIAYQLNQLTASIGTVDARVTSEVLARVNGDGVLAASVQELRAEKDADVGGVLAQVNSERQARIDGDGALAASVEVLRAEKDVGEAALAAQAVVDRQARIDGDGALSSSIDALRTEKNDDIADVSAHVQTERQARIDADGAIAASVEELRAEKNSDIGELSAEAILERQARIDRDAAIAASVDALKAEKNDDISEIAASVDVERQARIDQDATIAASVETLRAEKNDDIGHLSAEVATERQARIDEAGAIAASVETLSATVDGHTGEIIDQRAVLVDLEGRVTAYLRISAVSPDGTVFLELVSDSHSGSRIVLGGNVFALGVITAENFVNNALVVPAFVYTNTTIDGPGWGGGPWDGGGNGGVGGGSGSGGGGTGGGDIP
jgi:hypothetical protein